MGIAVLAAHQGKNATLIKACSDLYVRDGAVVADVTYGKGAFWAETDTARFTLLKTDIRPVGADVGKADFCKLPYENDSIDVVVLDPPYVHNPGVKTKHMMNNRYENAETTAGMYHDDILRLYLKGMTEARRVLKDKGVLWVKCKDEVESGHQCWSHIELYAMACSGLGLYAQDLFILVTRGPNAKRWKGVQRHARKNNSFLWVLRKGEVKLPSRQERMKQTIWGSMRPA